MGFTKISNMSLTELFVQQIEDMIISGELKIGEKLPSARDLCEKMGVSRPVISAGVMELAKLGFVDIRSRQGVFVSDYRRNGTVETVAAIMRYHNGMMRKNEVISLLQIREVLEQLCVRLVMDVASDEGLRALEPILDEINTDIPELAAEGIFHFHHEMAVLSENVLLPLMYHSFKPQSVYLWTLSCKQIGVDIHYEQKKRLYERLLKRDREGARDEIMAGIQYGESLMRQYLT